MDKHIAENLERACRSILVNTRNELYLKMRFLDVALSSFIYIMDWDIYRMGTDGIQMQYHPKDLGGLYREDRVMVNRLYLHTVLHCIFRHLIRRNGREKELCYVGTLFSDIKLNILTNNWKVMQTQFRC